MILFDAYLALTVGEKVKLMYVVGPRRRCKLDPSLKAPAGFKL